MTTNTPSPPTKIAALLFPGFQLLDICGPLDILNILSKSQPLELSILSNTLNPVSTSLSPEDSKFSQSMLPTHTFESAPADIEVLIIPGGLGTRDPANTRELEDFVKGRYEGGKGGVTWILTVCTGSAVLARTGILDGRRATSNKRAFEWVKTQGPNVEWVAKARWVEAGDVWTSSGVSAGLDLTYAWVEHIWGREVADVVADSSEYERNRDAGKDRFAGRWGAF